MTTVLHLPNTMDRRIRWRRVRHRRRRRQPFGRKQQPPVARRTVWAELWSCTQTGT
jgi:hypothetical protein